MAAANSDYPDPPMARLVVRLVEGRWLVAAAAAFLLVLFFSGALGAPVAVLIFVAFAAAIAVIPRTRPLGDAIAPARVAPTASLDPGVALFADALPDPCFVLDRRGIVRYANDRAAATFQIRAGEALTFRLRVPDLIAAFDRVAKGGPPVRVEFSERVPTERWFAAWFAPLGNTGLIVLLIDDMSERRNADRVRVDFVANASHELRTPLASLAGFVETLQGPARDDPAARDRFLGIMREQAERMSRLVNDLLSLSRIEMKAHVRPSDRVDLIAVVRHVVDALEPLARDLGVTVETKMPQRPVEVIGDRDELTQVFENLIENACKYGQNGKRVVVSIAVGEGAGPQVTIRDFGPGIPEEHLPRLTERFYRVDVEDSRRHRGTGLGLAIVKHILARHQSRLAVVSRLGEGAAFTVTFPQALPGRAQAPAKNSEPDETLKVS
jgi:two-component system, OmpR family, phosphate regulon sensor histidine kinase PhoR